MWKNKLCGHTYQGNTIYAIRVHQNMPFFITNLPKMATFCHKLSFLAKKYQFLAGISVFWVVVVLWCPPHPILRVLDSMEDVLHAIEDITQLFQGHQYQRNIIFCQKNLQKMPILGPNHCVLGPCGQLLLPVPYLEGAGFKGRYFECH